VPILQDIARQLLKVECAEISLVRSGEPALSIKGPGTIFVDQAGQICFAFDVSTEQFKPFTKSRLERPRPVPERPKDDDYFELEAVSDLGRLRGRLLYPDIKNSTPDGFWDGPGTAEGKVHQLSVENEADSNLPSCAQITMPRKLVIPRIERPNGISDEGSCYFEFDREKIEIRVDEGFTEIRCSVRRGGIAANRHWRMIEAIEFAFGQSIYPCGIQVWEDGKSTVTLISTVLGTENEGQLPPPVSLAGRVHHYPITALVRKFYWYVSPYTEEFPPLVAHGLWGLRQAANAQPDPKALVFSIAAETLINTCFPNIKPVDAKWRSEVEALKSQIKSDTTLSDDLRKRASNKLAALTNFPNDEKLYAFICFHVAKKADQDAIFDDWKNLRNPASHGKKIDLDEIENTLRLIKVALDLCYSIVLCRIGYFHERLQYANPYISPWRPQPLNPSDSRKPTLGSTIVLRNLTWTQTARAYRKEIPLGSRPNERMALVVRALRKKPSEFRIEVGPRAIVPDEIATDQLKKTYRSLLDAQQACDEIAERALVHITLQHFASEDPKSTALSENSEAVQTDG
jgi:hypothetical protein